MSGSTATPEPRSDRFGLVLAGVVIVLISLVPLVGGGVLVGVHETQRDDDGYYASGHNALSTPTRALVSDELEVGDGDGPGWLFEPGRLGTLRVTASGTRSKPVFVGIAERDEVDAYLAGVSRDEITDFELDPFSVDRTRHAGNAVPERPATRGFWAESATGSGEQSIAWPVKEGDWAVVVMNADGSTGVATRVSVGAKIGLILWLGVAALAVGVLFLAAAVVALVAAGREPRSGRRTPATPSRASETAVEGI
jgi:hypothetical protein